MNIEENRIVLILPYFGKFPNFFPFFLKSIEANSTIDLLLITDNLPPNFLPKNILWIQANLDDVNSLIKEKIGNYKIYSPYKLCDFKPAFGHIFEDYIKKYKWWGWTDCDLIYGDISSFLIKIDFENYDKINYHGHFCLLKNTKKMTLMYRNTVQGLRPFDFIFKSKLNFNFDEGGRGKGIYGFPNICKENHVRCFYKRSFADVFCDRLAFQYKTFVENKRIIHMVDYFNFADGKLFSYENSGKVLEILYAHFQGRKFIVEGNDALNKENKFYITPNCFSVDLCKFDKSNFKKIENDFSKNLKQKKRKAKHTHILFLMKMLFSFKYFDKRWR